jgi:hypothetical protein
MEIHVLKDGRQAGGGEIRWDHSSKTVQYEAIFGLGSSHLEVKHFSGPPRDSGEKSFKVNFLKFYTFCHGAEKRKLQLQIISYNICSHEML